MVEHAVFQSVFERIERALPACTTLPQLRAMAGIVEGLLGPHGESETNLAYAALDHALAERGQLDRLHQDHQEFDAALQGVQRARSSLEARQLLKAILGLTREHFRYEERELFPMFEQVLSDEVLTELGAAWIQRRTEAQPAAV